MFKSTLFIAVQCCQCSTMQVKQQKKSSSKWNCAVCNQKQSVKKVYAQGYQAKDIRTYVQSFNMSRKFADDQQAAAAALDSELPSVKHFVEHLEGNEDEKGEKITTKRRTDWSEYIGDEEEDEEPSYLKSKPKANEMFEPHIVTEIPDEIFKKPKLKENYNFSSSELGSDHTYKPHFSKRDNNKKLSNPQVAREEITTIQPRFSRLEKQKQQQQQNKHMTTAKKGVSKWSEYMTEDEDDCFEGEKAAFTDDLKLMYHYDPESTDIADQRVEEDVHPDFM